MQPCATLRQIDISDRLGNQGRNLAGASQSAISASRNHVMSKFLSIITTAAALFAATPSHAEDAFPNHPIRLIVCLPAGGGVDTVSRMVADKMSKILGQP